MAGIDWLRGRQEQSDLRFDVERLPVNADVADWTALASFVEVETGLERMAALA